MPEGSDKTGMIGRSWQRRPSNQLGAAKHRGCTRAAEPSRVTVRLVLQLAVQNMNIWGQGNQAGVQFVYRSGRNGWRRKECGRRP